MATGAAHRQMATDHVCHLIGLLSHRLCRCRRRLCRCRRRRRRALAEMSHPGALANLKHVIVCDAADGHRMTLEPSAGTVDTWHHRHTTRDRPKRREQLQRVEQHTDAFGGRRRLKKLRTEPNGS